MVQDDETLAELLCMAGYMLAEGCLLADSFHLGKYHERPKGMKMEADGANLLKEIYLKKESDLLSLAGLLGLSLVHALGV